MSEGGAGLEKQHALVNKAIAQVAVYPLQEEWHHSLTLPTRPGGPLDGGTLALGMFPCTYLWSGLSQISHTKVIRLDTD